MIKKYTIMLAIFFGLSTFLHAQVSGTILDDSSQPLPGVSIVVKGTTTGTTSDFDGNYSIDANQGDTLVFSYVGFDSQEVVVSGSTVDVTMKSGVALDEIVLVGTRSKNRTAINSPVPIDVIDVTELTSAGPQTSVNDILNYVAPSFTSTTQTVSDGTDHIDPASLRGLGPDQVLVLVNGKRRHTSSLVNVNSTVGRGSVGTDLNAIPAFAIKRIEVLRDGAAAQYGSDAIAGVINIVMKESEGLELQVNSGANFTSQANNQDGGVDGENIQIDANYGIPLGDKGGFVNFTGSVLTRNPGSRAGRDGATGQIFDGSNSLEWQAMLAGFDTDLNNYSLAELQLLADGVPHFSAALQSDIDAASSIDDLRGLLDFDTTDQELALRGQDRRDYSMRVGQSKLRSGKFFANMEIPLSDDFSIYSFGGISYRNGEAAGFYRRPAQSRANTAVYINGFLPEIQTDVNDKSLAVGIKGKQGDWDIDFSNTWGRNSFDFTIANSSNATLGTSTPLETYAGGFAFSQNTTNLDVSRFYDSVWSGLNVAFGAEYRLENYELLQGSEASWATYDINGDIWNGDASLAVTDFFGRQRPGGVQVFPGFRPENERDARRNSYAVYADIEADVTDRILIGTALRFENYSDFGSTLNWKVSSLFKVNDNFNLRAAASTGFRAPSLHQLHFNATSTNFVNGVPNEVGTFSNDSRIAKLLGIPELKEEESFSASVGLAAKIPSANLTVTVDAFFTAIEDRTTLTGNFFRPDAPGELQTLFDAANATRARFFANAIDTETKGIDVVITHRGNLSDTFKMTTSLAGTVSRTMQVDDIHASQQLAPQIDTYFGERERYFLEFAQPRVKANLTNMIEGGKWRIFVRNAYFGSVFNPDLTDTTGDGVRDSHPEFSAKIVTDLSFGYKVNERLTLTVGANNLFDKFPDDAPDDLTSGNNFIYPRVTSQFGQNGRQLFARLNFKL